MQISLRMLNEVSWCGEPIAGPRPRALLSALVDAGDHGASVSELVDAVWQDNPPANPRKALQVLVSRLRTTTVDQLIERTRTGYRIGLDRHEVDVFARADLTSEATAAHAAGRSSEAAEKAHRALELGVTPQAQRIVALTASERGVHRTALPLLEEATRHEPHDEELIAALLRSLANLRGPAAALDRYESYRQAVAERLGTDPGPALQRVHRELLGADRPQRSGVNYDATPLLGRDTDLSNLQEHLSRARLVSILGPGGLGKTRLAHVLARLTHRPVVYFVELVTASSAEQVIGTVAATLGIRDSLASRRAMTAEQRADARGRIAQRLDEAPTLLILDNCEHVVGAVADLVAYLLASVSDLQVLTTSRTPLRIPAEQVYPLGQLSSSDAQQLFRARALAARPGTVLQADAVAAAISHLDGLPLAIELAAAQVRVMPVTEITRRLADRFNLLRGGDRSAPDRHQTLLSVIDWSWNLLEPTSRESLMRLSVFHDGFTAACAEVILGPPAADAVAQLVDQSLLVIVEHDGELRYRMLETVRELGLLRLREAHLVEEAHAAQRAWARALCAEQAARLHGPTQLSAITALRVEEANLTDVLRHAFQVADRDTALVTLAALATFWTITGNHLRIIAFFDPVEEALTGWEPPTHLVEPSRQALAVVTTTAAMVPEWFHVPQARRVLSLVGSESEDQFVRAMCLMSDAVHDADQHSLAHRLTALTEHPQRFVAMTASALLATSVENAGEPARAVSILARAISLAHPDDGPWLTANYQTMIAQLHTQLGNPIAAVPYARRALEVLEQLAPMDDAIQCRGILAIAALSAGHLESAEESFEAIAAFQRQGKGVGLGVFVTLGQAELALAQGRVDDGLELLHAVLSTAPRRRIPDAVATELSPWTLLGEGTALAAYAWHAPKCVGQNLARHLASKAIRALESDASHHDFPVLGTVLFSLATWGLLKGNEQPTVVGRLLAVAERFGYNRFLPSLHWEPVAAELSLRAPRALAEELSTLGDKSRSDLLLIAQQAIQVIVFADN